MHISKVLLPCIIGLALSYSASAEIYQSKDAQGNTVYSDMPSQGAAAVEVPPTNSADPVVAKPRPSPSPATPAKPQKSSVRPASSEREGTEETDYDYRYYGDNDGRDEIDDKTRREKRRDDVAQPKEDRPVATPHRNAPRPASGGTGLR